jgi:flagellar M-ring protein FliF
MDNAVAKATPLLPAAQAPGNGLGARWMALPARLQLMSVAGVATLLAILAMMFLGARDSDYRPLYASLSEKDGGQVIAQLAQMNVPYRFAENGSTILVPSGKVHELRMKLAALNLPAGSANGGAQGYELLDKTTMGTTQGQERMKIQRALEGELITTIQSLEAVKSARVHLAMPATNGFFREQQKPSASVKLELHAGRTLDRGQIAGIVKLVSGSVPELSPKSVVVIDGTGSLLSSASDDDSAQGMDSQQLAYRREVEASHLKRVMSVLVPVLGADNVRATVSAEMDFSQVTQTAETFRPNQGPDAKPTVREQKIEESNQPGSATPSGVPGATSNQPPVPASAPINGPAQALQAAQGGANGNSTRRENATRFEVDRTTTYTRNAVGKVRRLTAAVVINHRSSTDAKGKTTSAPLPDKEIEQLTALVQQGLGFDADRGDVVKVVSAPFRVDVVPPVDELPIWKQPWLIDLLKTAAAPLALAVVALVVVSKLIRPTLAVLLAPPPPPEPGEKLDEVVDDTPALPPPAPPVLAPPPGQGGRVDAARAMAKANPAAVANIVRGWVNGEAA